MTGSGQTTSVIASTRRLTEPAALNVLGQPQQPVRVHRPAAGQRQIEVRQLHVPGHVDHLRRHGQVVARRPASLVRTPAANPASGSSSAARMPSIEPYFAISRAAVFSPTPATPGSPSLGSPRKCREVRVLRAGDAVLGGHRGVIEHLEIGHAATAVEHPDRAGVVDQLDQIPVAGDHLDRRRPRSSPACRRTSSASWSSAPSDRRCRSRRGCPRSPGPVV